MITTIMDHQSPPHYSQNQYRGGLSHSQHVIGPRSPAAHTHRSQKNSESGTGSAQIRLYRISFCDIKHQDCDAYHIMHRSQLRFNRTVWVWSSLSRLAACQRLPSVNSNDSVKEESFCNLYTMTTLTTW